MIRKLAWLIVLVLVAGLQGLAQEPEAEPAMLLPSGAAVEEAPATPVDLEEPAVVEEAMAEPESGIMMEAGGDKVVGLVGAGPVDPATLRRVRDFVELNLALPVKLLEPAPSAMGSLDEIGMAAAGKAGDEIALLVVVAYPEEEIEAHGVLRPEKNVAVVNARSLEPVNEDRERYARRVERGVMQAVGMLLGLPSCPNPQCVLWAYQTLQELDAKGRNYCPPCLERAQKSAMTKGISLIKSSPYATQ